MHSPRADLLGISVLAAFIALPYSVRMCAQPLVGEETRWATAAREMLATGDWIVPRQQGMAFPERPPMTIWLMAAGGWLRGDVDPIAIRLPSVVAIVLTSILVYCYTRVLASQGAAVIAALAYASFGQVLQIGRLGESEAVFTLFLAGSLLIWHLGLMRNWRPLALWTISFALAALASLVKGPQAPVYFCTIVAAYLLLVRRDWRLLVSWQFCFGIGVYLAIVGAWQIPFYRAEGWQAVAATWAGLAADRFNLPGILSHAVTYPFETFACLLPWSPLLVTLAHSQMRKRLAERGDVVGFLLTAIAVAYPTVWLAAGARGRYFMPLYPLFAVLIGIIIERSAMAEVGTYPRRGWRQFLLLWSLVAMCCAVIMALVGVSSGTATKFHQPQGFGLAVAAVAGVAAVALWSAYRQRGRSSPIRPVIAISTLAAVGVAGIMVNINIARWNNPVHTVEQFRRLLPIDAELVSLTPIEHRFAYYFGKPIAELRWPREMDDLPSNVDYFCFMRMPGDTKQSRAAGRGRTWYKTPGALPFAWRELKAASVDRRIDSQAMVVVLGQVVRPLQAEVSDATVPQRDALRLPAPSLQR